MATIANSLLSLMLMLAVTISGVHAKELTSLSQASSPSAKKARQDDTSHVKIHHDPHTHVDKQVLKAASHVSGDNPQADNRTQSTLEQRGQMRSVRMGLGWRFLIRSLFRLSYA